MVQCAKGLAQNPRDPSAVSNWRGSNHQVMYSSSLMACFIVSKLIKLVLIEHFYLCVRLFVEELISPDLASFLVYSITFIGFGSQDGWITTDIKTYTTNSKTVSTHQLLDESQSGTEFSAAVYIYSIYVLYV